MKRAFILDVSPRSHTSIKVVPGVDSIMVGVSDGSVILSDQNVPSGIGYDKLLRPAEEAELTGAYHYLRYNVPADQQLDNFFNAIEGFGVDYYMLDFERKNNQPSLAFAEMAGYVYREMSVFAPTLFYSNRGTIQEWLFKYDIYFPRDDCNLHIAQYPYTEPPPRAELLNVPTDESWQPVLPAGCTNWRMWQFSAGGNGRMRELGGAGNSAGDIDVNVFNGTISDMKEWIGIQPPPPSSCRIDTINECIQALEELK